MRQLVARAMASLGLILAALTAQAAVAAEPVNIGSRLELFVDSFLIDRLSGGADFFVHEPRPEEVVLTTDQPWEGNTCAYYTIFKDGDLYRMYYRGSHFDEKTRKSAHPEVTCYAESKDGIHWTRPKLGIYEWEGSKDNNIVLTGPGAHCFVAFRDDRPGCPKDARYKGISRGRNENGRGLFVYQSPDAVHWKLIIDRPVITEGAFDSQNLAFWDPATGKYVDYHRVFVNGVRAIMTCTSDDYINWTDGQLLTYPGKNDVHLYTNAIRPYERAPHIRIGFPTRYIPSTQAVEPIFMASRDGVTFNRFDKPIIPRTAPKDRDGNRSNYMAHGLVSLPGNDRELAVYGTEAYYEGPDSRLRRFMYRVDGFVSIRAAGSGGELLSKPVVFSGNRLVINAATNPGGKLLVELQDADGKPLPGFTAKDCQPFNGDQIAHTVAWKGGSDLAALAGKPIRVRFQINDGDLYSIQFAENKE